MRSFGVALLICLLVGCSNDTVEPIEEPTIPESEIEVNNQTITSFQEDIKELQEKLDVEESDALIGLYNDHKKDLQRRIDSMEEENALYENTLIYNDSFKVIDGTGLYIEEYESMLTTGTLVSGFSRDMLNELSRYKEEVNSGVGLIAVAPFESDGDKFPIITVFIEQEELENINFDEILKSKDDELYKIASYVKVHRDLADDVNEKSGIEVLPNWMTYYTGSTY